MDNETENQEFDTAPMQPSEGAQASGAASRPAQGQPAGFGNPVSPRSADPAAPEPPMSRRDAKAARKQAKAASAAPSAYVASSEAYFEPDSTFPQNGAVRYVPISAAGVTAPKPQKSRGWIVGIVAIVCICALIAFCVGSCSVAVSRFSTTTVSQSAAANSVAIIEIDSTIQYDWTANSPEGLKYLLDQAAADSNVKAVVLRVNSGGGGATAGEEMATYVKQFRETSGKPVVVSSASSNCSAAYWVSSQADYIFVAKTTQIGSIGVIMQTYDTSELMQKLGVNIDNITSADGKDSTYGTRALTTEERAYYQALVDEINSTFVAAVASGRHMTVDQVNALADGLACAGTTAVKNGLADEVGTLEDAVAKAAKLANMTEEPETYYLDITESSLSSLTSVLGKTNTSITLSDAVSLLKDNNNAVE